MACNMFNVQCPSVRSPKVEHVRVCWKVLLKLNILPSKHGKIDADITFYNLEKTSTLDESTVIYIFYMTNVYYVGTTKVEIKECYHIKKKNSCRMPKSWYDKKYLEGYCNSFS